MSAMTALTTTPATAAIEKRLSVSVNEAASILGVSRSSMWDLIRDKKIRSVLIAGRRLIPVTELQRLVNEAA